MSDISNRKNTIDGVIQEPPNVADQPLVVEDVLHPEVRDAIPKGLVTTDYLMSPATDDILFSAEELREGMIVLVEDWTVRSYMGAPLESLDANERMNLLRIARWCRVTRLSYSKEEGHVRFVGVYEDGTQFMRWHVAMTSWLVKLTSLPS